MAAGAHASYDEGSGLAAGLKAQDPAAFEHLIARYGKRVFGLARRILRDPSEAEEATQEVFMRLFEHAANLDEERDPRAYLMRVASNVCISRLRARKRSVAVSLDCCGYLEIEDMPTAFARHDWNPEELLVHKEGRQVLETAIAALPEDYRVILLLRDLEGLDNAEVAEILGASLPSVKSKLHRARLFLRDELMGYFASGGAG